MPISVVISNLARLGIQLLMLTCVYSYYLVSGDQLKPHWSLLILIPFLIIILGTFSLSLGILFSSLTTKYRDFTFLLGFGVQLIMFLSCIVFPASMFKGKIQFILLCNPVASVIEAVRYIITGSGILSFQSIGIGAFLTLVLLLLSILVFNRTERTFMDTV